ncbi:MAG: Fe-S cluster assembly protein SufB [Thermoplasmata archaeon]
MKDKIIERDEQKYNFVTPQKYEFVTEKGLSKKVVEEISEVKKEPDWMRRLRLKSLEIFLEAPMPNWGPDLRELNFDDITYYLRPESIKTRSWNDVPKDIKDTFEALGVPEMERKYLAGSVAQFESEGVYANIKKELDAKGVIFSDLDTALKEHPDIVKEYFMKAVPMRDNKFSALHGAVWSGGSFVYVPAGVKLDLPLMTYFRMNSAQEGQFEHTLIIAEKDSAVSYIEGCTAPVYNLSSLHSAVVEIYVKEKAKVRYTTVQNWSKDIYNLNTKRAWVDRDGKMEWVGGSLGSKVTMLYPSSYLRGERATASHLNIVLSSGNTWKDGGAKVLHLAPNTSSKVISKSISMDGGVSVYRGLLRISKGAYNSKSHVQCDALILDDRSKSITYPHNEVYEDSATVAHEASVGKIGEEELFYMQTRGLKEDEARSMIVLGFLDDVMKEIPLEFSLELNRLIKLEMSKLGAVG